MTEFDFNSLVDRAQVYDSYVQLISGSDKYRFKSLQKSDPKYNWPNIDRVSDDGKVFLNQQVTNHRFEMEIRLTADEVDTANPPTNTKTISYFIYRKNLRFSVMASVSTVYYAKDASSNNYMRNNFQFEIEEIGTPRINGDGDVAVNIAGRILLVSPAGADISPTFIRSSS